MTPVHSWIPVASIYLFFICCTLGYLIIPWVMIGEVYPTQVTDIIAFIIETTFIATFYILAHIIPTLLLPFGSPKIVD